MGHSNAQWFEHERTGWQRREKQKHEQCCMAFALTGRMYPPSITQGVALGWKLVALSGRRLPTKTGDDGSFLDYQTLSGRHLPTTTM